MPNALERLCQQKKLSYQPDAAGAIVQASGMYPDYQHPILLVEQSDCVVATRRFPICKKQNIHQVDRLCSSLTEMFGSGHKVLFDPDYRRFILQGVVGQEDIEDELTEFASECDVLLPLLERIGEVGSWSNELIDFAFASSAELIQ